MSTHTYIHTHRLRIRYKECTCQCSTAVDNSNLLPISHTADDTLNACEIRHLERSETTRTLGVVVDIEPWVGPSDVEGVNDTEDNCCWFGGAGDSGRSEGDAQHTHELPKPCPGHKQLRAPWEALICIDQNLQLSRVSMSRPRHL
jgi:hypothetical protein